MYLSTSLVSTAVDTALVVYFRVRPAIDGKPSGLTVNEEAATVMVQDTGTQYKFDHVQQGSEQVLFTILMCFS